MDLEKLVLGPKEHEFCIRGYWRWNRLITSKNIKLEMRYRMIIRKINLIFWTDGRRKIRHEFKLKPIVRNRIKMIYMTFFHPKPAHQFNYSPIQRNKVLILQGKQL